MVTNPTSIYEDKGLIPGLTQCIKDLALLGAVVYVGHRSGSNPVLLWLWLWLWLAATTLIGPLAWEPPYNTGAAIKRQKDQKKKKYTEAIS